MTAEILFYGGVAVCAVAAVCAAATAAVAFFTRKRLNRQLDEEYGKRRH